MSTIDLLWNATLAASGAISLALLLRRPARALFGPETAYRLWALVPIAIAVALLPAREIPVGAALLAPVAVVGEAVALPPARDWDALLLGVWLAGALATLALFAVQQRRYVRTLRAADGADRVHGHAVVRAPAASGGPAVVGALRPRIVVPDDFESRYDVAEQRLVLAHELAHIRRRDVLANAGAATLRALLWFDPLVHVAATRLRFDQELAVDARVLREAAEPGARRAYANAIFKTQLADSGLPVGCHWQSSHPLKERIEMLKREGTSTGRKRLGKLAIGALAAAFALTAYASKPADALEPDVAPTYAALSRPHYPETAIAQKQEGVVVVELRVGTDGKAAEAEVVAGQDIAPELQASALAAVRSWKFNPGTRDGKPVDAWIRVPITFSLNGDLSPEIPDAADTLDAINVSPE